MENWTPIRFNPIYRAYPWGGRTLPDKYSRMDCPTSGPIAESWEISDRNDGMSIIAVGWLAGRTLRDLMDSHSEEILGKNTTTGPFPLLVKIIDARDSLSIQVHPDDNAAKSGYGEAKSEAWYVIDCAPGACIYRGFLPGVTEADFNTALAAGTVDQLMNRQLVAPGDLIYVPGGTIHAIGAGCLLLEVQQNSNTTYRVFDWNRKDADGNSRPLHVDEAKKVVSWETDEMHQPAEGGRCITPYFTLEVLSIGRRPVNVKDPLKGCTIVFVEEGNVIIRYPEGETLAQPGTTWLIPAAMKTIKLIRHECDAANVVLIRGVRPA
ncbi:MAG TPA: class I mannose-6-phosphate isomerase [Kiritimatiellia bacterium]|nr:class I mannose-6-phosphate isomerase [Kiritimatiellia bacterium]